MFLQLDANLFELVVRLRHNLFQFGEMYRRADAGHHVFALRVGQIVAIENLFARARVAREANARAGIVAGVAEHHLLHVDAGAKQPGDLLDAAIGGSLLGHPRTEYRADRSPQLLHGIFGKRLPCLFLVIGLIFLDEFFPAAGRNRSVFLHAELGLQCAQAMLQVFLGHAHHYRGIHLHEAAIRVIREPVILGDRRQAFDRLIVQAKIQNCFHHAGHGAGRAGTHADQQRVLGIAELFPGDFFELGYVVCNLLFHFVVELLAALIEVVARFCGNGETGGNGETDSGHLRQSCTLAAEQIAPLAVAFRFTCTKKIDPLFHGIPHLFFLAAM